MNPTFQAFCENTSLHGWAYIATNRHKIIKLFWFSIIATGFVLAGIICSNATQSWQEEPTITTVSTFSYPVTDMQFPTVTICPEEMDIDKWGFMRSLLNEIDYTCHDEDDCNNNKIREDVVTYFLSELLDNFTVPYDDVIYGGGENDFKVNLIIERSRIAEVGIMSKFVDIF